MVDSIRDQLERAYQLIQKDQLDAAVSVLRPIVTVNPDHPDAWWLLANAVSEPDEAYEALINVLRLEPQHEQARELLNNLIAEFPELAAFSSQSVPPTPQPTVSVEDIWGTTEPEPIVNVPSAYSEPTADLDAMFGGESDPTSHTSPNMPTQPVQAANPVSNYDLDEFFKANQPTNANDDLHAVVSSNLREVKDSTMAGDDLDLLFGSKTTPPARRTGKTDAVILDDPLNDIFGNSDTDPSFLKGSKGLASRGKGNIEPDVEPDEDDQPTRWHPWRILALVVLIGLFVAIIGYLVNNQISQGNINSTINATATAVALVASPPTLDPNASPSAATSVAINGTALPNATNLSPTDAAAPTLASTPAGTPVTITREDTSIFLTATTDLFTGNGFPNAVVKLENNQFSANVCSVPDRQIQARILQAMTLLAQQTAQRRDTLTAQTLEVVNCNAPTTLLFRATVSIDAVTAFIDGNSKDVRSFRNAWK